MKIILDRVNTKRFYFPKREKRKCRIFITLALFKVQLKLHHMQISPYNTEAVSLALCPTPALQANAWFAVATENRLDLTK